MKKRFLFLLLSGIFIISLATGAISYDPEHWTKCITSGVDMQGNPVENNFWCVEFEGYYNGELSDLSSCQRNGLGTANCSGNSLAFFPAVY